MYSNISLTELIEAGQSILQSEADEGAQEAQDVANAQRVMCDRVRDLFHPSLREYISINSDDYRNPVEYLSHKRIGAHIELPNACRVSFHVVSDDKDGLKLAQVQHKRYGSTAPMFSVWNDASEFAIEQTDDLGRALAVAQREYIPAPTPKPPEPPAIDWLESAKALTDTSENAQYREDKDTSTLRAIAAALIDIAGNLRRIRAYTVQE